MFRDSTAATQKMLRVSQASWPTLRPTSRGGLPFRVWFQASPVSWVGFEVGLGCVYDWLEIDI